MSNKLYPVMVFLDQIISNFEQPLCVVRKYDNEILYKNLVFSKLISPRPSNKFNELFSLYCGKEYKNLAELFSNHSLVEENHVSQPNSNYVQIFQGRLH